MKKLQNRLFVIFFFFSLLVSGISILLFYSAANERVLLDIRQRLGDIVSIAASQVDARLHSSLVSPGQEGSEAYVQVQNSLQQMQQASSDIYFIYTMRRDASGNIAFVVDAETNPEDVAHLGEVYLEASELLRSRFDSMDGPVVEASFYTDDWGTWISGYAPFFNPDGSRAGVLGVDISADTVREYQAKLRTISLWIFFLTLPVFLFLGFFIGRRIAQPVIAMKRASERIGSGELDTRVQVKRSDELGHLAASLNDMAQKLQASNAQLQEMLNKYRNIFESAVEGIFQTTLDGKPITANDALVQMLGYADLEDLLATLADLKTQLYARPEDRDTMLRQLQQSGKVSQFEAPMKRKDGSLLWAELSARLVSRPDGTKILEGMLHDVTNRREKEKAEKEKEAAQLASKAKSEFLANMSHEIRTPLNAVMGMTDLMKRTNLSAQQRDYLQKIQVSSKTLLAVINDILDFSKIEAGRLELEQTQFSLYEVMANLSEIFARQAHEKKIEMMISIDKDTPNALVGDPVRLGQILINLTGNAIKFTSKGEVVISVRQLEEAAEDGKVMLEFSVRDTGVGIQPDRLSKIFDSFTQEDTSTTRKFGGTGLGLAICKQLSQLMGGGIEVESEPGKGSCFRFSARFVPQPKESQRQLRPPVDLRGLRVLIVDDNATSREILSRTIESFQMHPVSVDNAEDAIEMVTGGKQEFDLVLMDWKLPGMNGIQASEVLKRQKESRKAPIVFMVSAYAREDLMQETEKSVIDAFLHKPVNQSFLFDTIMGLFSKEGANGEWVPKVPEKGEGYSGAGLEGKKVLLVEDNAINQEIALEWLRSAGLVVDVADTGKKAVEMAKPGAYDLVLMDIQLPEMDGYQATRTIRARPEFAELPIIAMTAHALKGDREKCLEAGMNDYISKPIDPEKMFGAIRHWLNLEPGQLSRTPSTASGQNIRFEGDLPGIDVQQGLFRSNNNARLYEKLLRSFCKDYRDTRQKLEGFAQKKEDSAKEEARRLAHSFKGVGANLGAMDLSEKAAALEAEIKRGHFAIHSTVTRDFLEELERVIAGLDAFFSPEQPDATAMAPVAEKPTLSREEWNQTLQHVLQGLDDDITEAETQLAANLGTLKHFHGEERANALMEALETFDIDQAKQILLELIGQKSGE